MNYVIVVKGNKPI